MSVTCWRCRPASSPATARLPFAAGRTSAPTDVGPSCSSALHAWGSSCRAWHWNLPEQRHHHSGTLLVLEGGASLDFWVLCDCMRWVTVPICSFSKGSSISFRLASRRMSVQIYRQRDKRWERSQIKGCFIITHYRLHTTRWQHYCMFVQLLQCTLWTVAPKLANVDRQSMSTLRL